MGAFARKDRAALAAEYERVYELFPRLRERKVQKAGTLSGGEQQMLAIGRALMAAPKVLLLDEPSMGLSPILVEQIFDIIRTINEQWDDRAAGGAECVDGARHRAARLHPADRRGRAGRQRRAAARRTRPCARPTSERTDRVARWPDSLGSRHQARRSTAGRPHSAACSWSRSSPSRSSRGAAPERRPQPTPSPYRAPSAIPATSLRGPGSRAPDVPARGVRRRAGRCRLVDPDARAGDRGAVRRPRRSGRHRQRPGRRPRAGGRPRCRRHQRTIRGRARRDPAVALRRAGPARAPGPRAPRPAVAGRPGVDGGPARARGARRPGGALAAGPVPPRPAGGAGGADPHGHAVGPRRRRSSGPVALAPSDRPPIGDARRSRPPSCGGSRRRPTCGRSGRSSPAGHGHPRPGLPRGRRSGRPTARSRAAGRSRSARRARSA